MKHHKFTEAHIKFHKDGSHTTHLVHEDGAHADVHAGHADHDAMMDHMMHHTAAPNPGEADADAGTHGIAPPEAAAAGIPAGPAGIPAGPAGGTPAAGV